MLPEKEFHCARYQDVRADKYGMVTVDKKQYSTSPRFAKQQVRNGGQAPILILYGNELLFLLPFIKSLII